MQRQAERERGRSDPQNLMWIIPTKGDVHEHNQ